MESTVALKQNSVPDKNMILYKLGNLRALISIGCQVKINLEITSKEHPSVYRVKFIMLIKKSYTCTAVLAASGFLMPGLRGNQLTVTRHTGFLSKQY